jgi:hypothetical protein
MGPGEQLYGVHQVAVPGDLPVVISIEPDDLSQHVGVGGIGFGARCRMPLPVPSRRQRVDREHLVSSGAQRPDPRAAVGFNPHHHPTRDFLRG